MHICRLCTTVGVKLHKNSIGSLVGVALTRYMDGQTDGRTDRVIPIYPPPPQTLFAGGIKKGGCSVKDRGNLLTYYHSTTKNLIKIRWKKYFFFLKNRKRLRKSAYKLPKALNTLIHSTTNKKTHKNWMKIKNYIYLSYRNVPCALNLISTFLLLSLGRYLCWWTISPCGHYHPSSQCFGTDMVY